MADPFLGEIRIFGFPFAPAGWALCQGQLLSIGQNQALFSLLGTYYGGNGTSNFGLPDLMGRVPRFKNTNDNYGDKYGVETQPLTQEFLPAHTHTLQAGGSSTPLNNVPAGNILGVATMYTTQGTNMTTMAADAVTPSAGVAHTNVQPSLVLNYCIALQGIFPSRS